MALLVYSSFRGVATSGFRNKSVATSNSSWIRQAVLKWGVNTESHRTQHSTAARDSYESTSDVTRLLATGQVRNKYSLRQSISLQLSQATCSSILNNSTVLNCRYCHQSNQLHWKGGFIINFYVDGLLQMAAIWLKNSVNIRLFGNGSVLIWVDLVWWSVYNTYQYFCRVDEVMYGNLLN